MSRRPASILAVMAVACAAGALAGIGAAPAADLRGYGGAIPFDCVLQQVGRGTDFPDPDADPFCVEYDKRGQNIDDLSIGRFLRNEPARVAAASDKCFYYQRDHWRSRIVGESDATETYNFDGSYFFDKARGEFGVYAENFTIGNQTVDPTALPGFPARYEPYFGEGRGGVRLADSIPVDPRCVHLAERSDPYRGDGSEDPGEGDPGDGGDQGGERGEGTDRPRGGPGSESADPGFSEAVRNPRFTG